MSSRKSATENERTQRRKLSLVVLTVIGVLGLVYIGFMAFFAADEPGRIPNPVDTIEGTPATERHGDSDGGRSEDNGVP